MMRTPVMNIVKAYRHWLKAASEGNAQAQMYLGHLFQQGLGVPKSQKNTLHWYCRVANQGLPEAQYQLGLMYELGMGIKPDIWEAEAWYKRATDQGFCPRELNDPAEIFY